MSVCGAVNLRTKSRELQPPKAASNKRACLFISFAVLMKNSAAVESRQGYHHVRSQLYGVLVLL